MQLKPSHFLAAAAWLSVLGLSWAVLLRWVQWDAEAIVFWLFFFVLGVVASIVSSPHILGS